MSRSIEVHQTNQIATVILNRPSKMNALNLAAWKELTDTMNRLSNDDDIRCVVIRGAGERAFSTGADISEFPTHRMNSMQAKAYAQVSGPAMEAITACRHPTLALIQGACVGGGLEIATICDLRICAESSKFGVPVKKLGLVLSYGELDALIALTGTAVAMEILLEGRIFGAQEALEKRLVNRIVRDDDLIEEGLASAERIAAGAPLVARWHKKFSRRLADKTPLSDEDLSEAYECFDTQDFNIGYRAFMTKTDPTFIGR